MEEPHHSTEAPGNLLIRARVVEAEILGNPGAGLSQARALADEALIAGEWRAAAVALSSAAWALRECYDHPAAAVAVEEAIDAARRAKAGPELARALIVRSMIRLEQGQTERAQDDLAAAREAGRVDPELALATSVIAEKTGQLSGATSLLQELVFRSDCPPAVRVKAMNNLGCLLAETEPDRALAVLGEALDLATGEFEHAAAIIEHNRGEALAYAGRIPQALATFDHARQMLTAVGGPAAEHHMEVAQVLGRLRLLPEARDAARRALLGLAGEGGALMRPDALLIAGRLARQDGDQAGALSMLTSARELYGQQGRPHGRAVAVVELARLTRDNPPTGMARSVIDAADTLSALGLGQPAARALLLAGRLAESAGEPALADEAWARAQAAAVAVDPGVELEARARRAVASADVPAAMAATQAALDVIDQRSLLADAADLRHRICAERVRFEQLRRRAGHALPVADQVDVLLRARPWIGDAGGWGEEADSDRLLWRQLARRLVASPDQPEAAAALRREFNSVERRLRQRRWSVPADVWGRRPDGLPELLGRDAERDVVVIARVGADAVGYRLRSPTGPHAVPLGPWRSLTEELAQAHRALSRASGVAGPAHARAWEVARAALAAVDRRVGLLAPPGPVGEEPGEVVLVVDRGLEGAPWGGLPSWWGRRLAVSSLAAPGRPPDRPRRPPRVVLVASGPGLVHADAEVALVSSLWEGAEVALCPDSASARGRLADADVVHVAAHATLRWDSPLQSRIELHDGPMAVGELLDAGARPEVLYLSCCSLGSSGPDPALVGAVPMLAQEGVGAVVASTTPLSDRAAPLIARAVHASVREGAGPAAGLARARSACDPRDPGEADLWCALAGVGVVIALP